MERLERCTFEVQTMGGTWRCPLWAHPPETPHRSPLGQDVWGIGHRPPTVSAVSSPLCVMDKLDDIIRQAGELKRIATEAADALRVEWDSDNEPLHKP